MGEVSQIDHCREDGRYFALPSHTDLGFISDRANRVQVHAHHPLLALGYILACEMKPVCKHSERVVCCDRDLDDSPARSVSCCSPVNISLGRLLWLSRLPHPLHQCSNSPETLNFLCSQSYQSTTRPTPSGVGHKNTAGNNCGRFSPRSAQRTIKSLSSALHRLAWLPLTIVDMGPGSYTSSHHDCATLTSLIHDT